MTTDFYPGAAGCPGRKTIETKFLRGGTSSRTEGGVKRRGKKKKLYLDEISGSNKEERKGNGTKRPCRKEGKRRGGTKAHHLDMMKNSRLGRGGKRRGTKLSGRQRGRKQRPGMISSSDRQKEWKTRGMNLCPVMKSCWQKG